MDIVRNKAVVAQFDELGNSGGDLALLDTLCTPDMVNHALAADRPQGLEGTREFLRNARRQTHGGRWISSVVVAEGRHGGAVRCTRAALAGWVLHGLRVP